MNNICYCDDLYSAEKWQKNAFCYLFLLLLSASLNGVRAPVQPDLLVPHFEPEMMYDLILLQHKEVILEWLHNATKMPCQYLLCQYSKVLPRLYWTMKEGYQMDPDSMDFTYHLLGLH